jgi:hypothetical protein
MFFHGNITVLNGENKISKHTLYQDGLPGPEFLAYVAWRAGTTTLFLHASKFPQSTMAGGINSLESILCSLKV